MLHPAAGQQRHRETRDVARTVRRAWPRRPEQVQPRLAAVHDLLLSAATTAGDEVVCTYLPAGSKVTGAVTAASVLRTDHLWGQAGVGAPRWALANPDRAAPLPWGRRRWALPPPHPQGPAAPSQHEPQRHSSSRTGRCRDHGYGPPTATLPPATADALNQALRCPSGRA